MPKTCLITGINGFLASHAARLFAQNGYEIAGIHHAELFNREQRFRYYQIKLPSVELNEILRKERPSIVIHAAGTASVGKSMESPLDDFMISVPATAGLLDGIRKESPETTLIFLSSAAVYGNPETLPIAESAKIQPVSPYGFHKHMGELLCEEYASVFGLSTYVLRIFSAYGVGLRRQVIFDLASKMISVSKSGGIFEVLGSGFESRDFIHANDVANALLLLAEKRPIQRVFNAGSGQETTMKALIQTMQEVSDLTVEPVFTGNRRNGDPINWQSDISELESIGFVPSKPLQDGLRDIFDWLRK